MEPILDMDDKHESLVLKEAMLTEAASNPQDVISVYNKWGEKYDEHLSGIYEGPKLCAAAVACHIVGKPKVRILDVGCGTGLIAEKLAEHGFRNIEGLEPSEGMAQKAREKNLYKKIYKCFLTDKVDCLDNEKYDVVVGSGVVAPGHIPPSALSEVLRCLKPGGHAIFVTWEKFLRDCAMRDEMTRLEKEGKWKLVEETCTPISPVRDGLMLVFVKAAE